MQRSFLRQRKPRENSNVIDEDSTSEIKGFEPPQNQLKPFPFWVCFFVLSISRFISARSNIIHDCDETFNYWEPLHYLLYGEGLQTWEYSPEFGLRSYLYLILHGVFIFPVKFIFGNGANKFLSFYLLRMVLGFASATSESFFAYTAGKYFGRRLGAYTVLLLCLSSGSFTASTTLLPSTFSMYTMALSTAFLINDMPAASVSSAAAGVLIGWPFSVLATVPLVIHSLAKSFKRAFISGLITSAVTIILSVLVDRYFYGVWTCSVFNLVKYNVFGGGDSSLYGTESSLFYLKNLLINFNFALLLALLSPVCFLFMPDRQQLSKLAIATSPFFLWLGFMSLQAHKEERFMYVVYPHLCLSAAIVIEAYPSMLPKSLKGSPNKPSFIFQGLKLSRPMVLGLIFWLSYVRSSALLTYYSAPMEIYKHLPAKTVNPRGELTVCVGSEWHRFPSSFFLPLPEQRISFLDDGFRGLLPFPFSLSQNSSGNSPYPPHFNNKNVASEGQFVSQLIHEPFSELSVSAIC